jgi:hypothetical protein
MADNNTVRIHIDQKPYPSPNPTTGTALYALGHVEKGLALYKEVGGNREDKPVPDDGSTVHLKEDEHFHSAKAQWAIVVNAVEVVVDHDVLTFDELVKIAFPVPPAGPHPKFTITFEKAASKPHEGSLKEGQTVTVKNGTEFDVIHSNRS